MLIALRGDGGGRIAAFYNGRMQSLRRSRWLACLLLAWFVLSAGAATVSPFVATASLERICSGTGQAQFVLSGGPALPAVGHALDCPLCSPAVAPPPPVVVVVPQLVPPAHAAAPRVLASVAVRTAAPPPARGPPVAA